MGARERVRYQARELKELGFGGTAFRLAWELKRRTGIFALRDRRPRLDERDRASIGSAESRWQRLNWFTLPGEMRELMHGKLEPAARRELVERALAAGRGRIRCFGASIRDYGNPPDWHRDPVTGQRVDANLHWVDAMSTVTGDIKDLWEVGRLPHVYDIVRAVAYEPGLEKELGLALVHHVESFIRDNEFAKGVHWASGQEVAFRLFALTFGLPLFIKWAASASVRALALHVHESATHIERHIQYARRATYNNHLLSEAVGLLVAAALHPASQSAVRWRDVGSAMLKEGLERQFYLDGGYIQQSHNYHRVALQDLLWADLASRQLGRERISGMREAVARSVDFLHAHQARSGSLPNYGHNDGALVSPLSTMPFEDFRPTLQAASARFLGQRLYASGGWDEEAHWFGGELPKPVVARPARALRSFVDSGHHVLRDMAAGSFASFRCGTLKDRFTQCDMLHVDITWRDVNVAVDCGSYRYNGAPLWNRHFTGAASHNTVTVDDENQMVHFRQFKLLYPVPSRLLLADHAGSWGILAGEHHGYTRLGTAIVHRRAVLMAGADLWVVTDSILGEDERTVRLHWQLAPQLHVTRHAAGDRRVQIHVDDAAKLELGVFDVDGEAAELDVDSGCTEPPRGWVSRRYAEKLPAPSVCVVRRAHLPVELVTVFGAAGWRVQVATAIWTIDAPSGTLRFTLEAGIPSNVRWQPAASGMTASDDGAGASIETFQGDLGERADAHREGARDAS